MFRNALYKALFLLTIAHGSTQGMEFKENKFPVIPVKILIAAYLPKGHPVMLLTNGFMPIVPAPVTTKSQTTIQQAPSPVQLSGKKSPVGKEGNQSSNNWTSLTTLPTFSKCVDRSGRFSAGQYYSGSTIWNNLMQMPDISKDLRP